MKQMLNTDWKDDTMPESDWLEWDIEQNENNNKLTPVEMSTRLIDIS